MNQSSPNSIYDHSAGAPHAVPASNPVPASAPPGERNDSRHAVPAPEPPSPPSTPTRCPHLYPGGRHCRKPVFDQIFGLCRKHFAASQKNRDVADLTPELARNPQELISLEGLYDFLANLLILLAQNRVSTRRASVLAFITSQLTRIDTAIHRRDANEPPQTVFVPPRPIRD